MSKGSKNRFYGTLLKYIIWLFLTAIILVLGAYLMFGYSRDSSYSQTVCVRQEVVTNGGRLMSIGTKHCVLSLEKADTQTTRELGLSFRDSLPASQGMLFIFDTISEHCLWMKDMKFAIDMVWLDSQGVVVKKQESVLPNTFPEQFCAENSLYVIEVAAGVSKLPELQLGKMIKL